MIKKGVYAATLSVIDENGSLNIEFNFGISFNHLFIKYKNIVLFRVTTQSE